MASPLIRSVLYGGNTHAHPVVATQMLRRFGRMRLRGTIAWSNQSGTPTAAFRKWLKQLGWVETAAWRWNLASQSLTLPASKEVDSQAHQIRQIWRHDKMEPWKKA